MKLTRGEAWWLIRRRAGRTMPAQAKRLGISEGRLRAWEKNRAMAPKPTATTYLVNPLTDGEYASICRRRSGLYQYQVAKYARLSRVSVNRAELDITDTSHTLAQWWHDTYGQPRALAAAPIVVPYSSP